MKHLNFKVAFKPTPWKRPSGTHQRFDAQVADKNALALLIWQQIRSSMPGIQKDPMFAANEPVAVTLKFAFVKPRTSKLAAPTNKNDVDNLSKFVLDTLQSATLAGRVWEDDGQVVRLCAEKCFGEEEFIECSIEEIL